MKEKRAWAILVVVGLCCVGFIWYQISLQSRVDHMPPKISFPDGALEISVESDTDELLADVTARDDVDGDVTDLLIVEGISAIGEDHTVQVTYAAFDRSGNVAKQQRTVRYTDYQSPHFTLSQPLLFRSGSRFDVFDYVSAEDKIDGSLDGRIKATLVAGDTGITEPGVHEVQFRVTNSMGDTAYLTVPVEVYAAADYNATVELTQPLVYLQTGDVFRAGAYLASFTYGSASVDLGSEASTVDVSIDSDVSTNQAGCYSVSYIVRSGTYTGHTRLIVVVEE